MRALDTSKKPTRQLMLWETEVHTVGNGRAQIVAKKPVLEGNVDDARKILGGSSAVSRQDVYRLIRGGYIIAWKVRPGAKRKDKRASNCKLTIDLNSVLAHRERMQEDCMRPASRLENCLLF